MTSVPQLNACQQAAADQVLPFLLSDEKEMSICGPAGVGKTFLMHYIMNHLLPEYEETSKLLGDTPIEFTIELTATTNKATDVLTQATGFPAQTLHTFLRLQVFDDYATGKTRVKKRKDWTVHRKKLIFVDEASMIDSELHKILHEGTDRTCKIIYLGDDKQMAPVFEKLSPVYAIPKRTATLSTPVRNAGQPALMALCNQLRRTVETLDFQPIQPVPGIIDYVDDAGAQAFLDSTFNIERSDVRILCYSNHRVQEYNEYIRNLRGYPSHFVEGERVINNSAITLGSTILKIEQELVIHEHWDTAYPIDVENGVQLFVYDATIRTENGNVFDVKIPAEPEHYRALCNWYKQRENWERYFYLKNHFPDFRPRDAATVYKAQGSTYHTAFLDLGNIGTCTDYDQTARMLYVGASRATDRLVLYGQLPARFFNRAPALATA